MPGSFKLSSAHCQGTCEEEAARLETFLDTVRARAAALAAKQGALQRKCAAFGLPWEPQLLPAVAANAMHLATLYMSRCALNEYVQVDKYVSPINNSSGCLQSPSECWLLGRQ